MKVRAASHSLGIPQNDFVAWLKRLKWIYKGGGKLRAYSTAENAGHVETVCYEYRDQAGKLKVADEVTSITAKGLAVLSRKRTDGKYIGGSKFKAALHRTQRWLGVRS